MISPLTAGRTLRYTSPFLAVPQWWNGRRGRLKICCPRGRAGSSPAWGTNYLLFDVRDCPSITVETAENKGYYNVDGRQRLLPFAYSRRIWGPFWGPFLKSPQL